MQKGHSRKVIERLQEVQEGLGGYIRTSAKGVPHLILPGPDKYSVCYFSSSDTFRAWAHSGMPTNEHYGDFKTAADVIEHFSKQKEGATSMKVTHEEPTSGYRRVRVEDLKPGDVYVNGTHNPERLNSGYAPYMMLNASSCPLLCGASGFRFAVNLKNGNAYQHPADLEVWVADAETRFSLIKD